jgi:hypothetical protein
LEHEISSLGSSASTPWTLNSVLSIYAQFPKLDVMGLSPVAMSLIHTCELNGADPFDYLNQLQRHAEELKQTPSDWMPWNYRQALARTGALLDAA